MFIPFFHIAQFVVCAQHHKLLVTDKSEVMGIGRKLSSQIIAQAVVLDNFSYSQIYMTPCRLLQECSTKKCKQIYRQTGYFRMCLVQSTPCHIIVQWFEDPGIQVIHQPPSSPHMNPHMNLIEPILAHVVRELSHNPPTTLRELRMRVHQIWNEISRDYLE